MRLNSLKYCVLIAFSSLLFVGNTIAAPTADAGKTLFQNYCASCHNKNMKDDLTGPALGGVQDRWAAYPREDLYAWIKNSQVLIKEGHPRAVELWTKYKTLMNAFPSMTPEEMESILLYVDAQLTKAPVVKTDAKGKPSAPSSSNKFVYWILFGVLFIVVVILARVIASLKHIVAHSEGQEVPHGKSIIQQLTSKGVIGFLIFALVVLGGYTTVNNGIAFGRQQGYKPDQPIKFSHETHA